jgi:stage IV sporulation protein FB
MPTYQIRPDRDRPPGWQILSIAGVPFYIEPSFLFFMGIIIFSQLQYSHSFSQAGLLGFVIFFSLLAHEAGHGLLARFFGYRDITISLVMFGGNTRHPPATRGQSLLITLAGPAATVGLAALAWYLMTRGWTPADQPAGRYLLGAIFYINLFWAAFNLLPIYPMDGGQALFHLLSFVASERFALLAVAFVSIFLCAGFGFLLLTGAVRLAGGGFFMVFFILMFFGQNLQIIRSLWKS